MLPTENDKPVEIKLDDKALAEIERAKSPDDVTKSTEVKVPQEKQAEDGIDVLKAQLAELNERAEADRTARAETDRVAREREQEIARLRGEREQARVEITDTRYHAILNTIDAFKRDGELAKRDYAAALGAGSFEAAADAQERLSRAQAQLVQLEAGKAALEEQSKQMEAEREAAVRNPQTQTRTQTPTERFDAYVSQFSQRSQAYLRQHPEYAMDDRLNRRLLRAHGEAVDDQGLNPDTDAYFKYLDERMGATGAAAIVVPPVRQNIPSAAPVSRQPMNGAQVSGTVILSPAEREAARIAGIAEIDYARHLLAEQAAGNISRH